MMKLHITFYSWPYLNKFVKKYCSVCHLQTATALRYCSESDRLNNAERWLCSWVLSLIKFIIKHNQGELMLTRKSVCKWHHKGNFRRQMTVPTWPKMKLNTHSCLPHQASLRYFGSQMPGSVCGSRTFWWLLQVLLWHLCPSASWTRCTTVR